MKSPFGSHDTPSNPGVTVITIRNLSLQVHSPPATKSAYHGGTEQVARLATRAPVALYPVDAYPGCPSHWMRSDDESYTAAYFMEARKGHMVWFDLNENCQDPHHVAALFSAQGVCALTGQKMKSAKLEQYRACPVHNYAFQDGRHCPRCGYDWPPQNYLATTATSSGTFWRDGFRAEGGVTREFVFTEDARAGVAANIIGDERVDAFGVALFRSREPKPQPRLRRGGGIQTLGGGGGLEGLESFGGATRGGGDRSFRSMEVAAGALVRQGVERDPNDLSYWETLPDAQIVVHYVGSEQFRRILASGPVRRRSFLQGGDIPTGHNG